MEMILFGVAVVLAWWATVGLAVYVGWRIAVAAYRRNPRPVHITIGEGVNRLAGMAPRPYRS